ncbi:AAA family ATPase [Pseudomonas protegens]|uniref:AAA family ATPase n=1 Tax=Pseudomonas protegens TaxID=380021 RepID=UPI002264DE35|nr:AAA family ATPase [Pseudomonas protegens]
MRLVHIYINEHKGVRDLNVSLGGKTVFHVDGHNLSIEYRVDTSSYYNGYQCSAIIGANGVGKSTILDFLESVYFPIDSSGILIFLDENSKIYACQINYQILHCPEPLERYDDYEAFAKLFSTVLVKINNVSAAQSRLGYERKHKHSLIQERSLEHYTTGASRKKMYFDNLLDYLRWNQSSSSIVQDVGFEFKFQNSFRRMKSMVRPDMYYPKRRVELENAYNDIQNKRKILNPTDQKDIFEFLVAALSTSIIVELAASSGAARSVVLAVLHVHFINALVVGDLDFRRSIFQSLEALRYDENWDVFITDKQGRGVKSISPVDIDINKMQAIYSEHLDALRDISEVLVSGRRISVDETESLIVLVDEFSFASKAVYLSTRLPRNILSNISWGWRGISTGEMAYTHLFSETYNCAKKSKNVNYIIVIDEADLYLHPEWQRCFLDSYLELLESLSWKSTPPQIIITTHSPIIVSDFLPQDIVSLVKDAGGKVEIKESLGFGTNITNLFIDGMHLTATVGEHSRKAIVSLVEKSESQKLSSLDKELIKGMGNKFVREYLLQND